MIKDITYISSISLTDFQKSLANTSGYVQGIPSQGEWTYDNELKSLHINLGGTTSKYATFPIQTIEKGVYLDVGDLIETQVSFLNVSGDKGLIAIDYSEYEDFSTFEKVDTLITTHGDNFEIANHKHVAHRAGYYRVVAGLLWGSLGEIYMRDFLIKISKKQSKDNNKNQRVAVLRKLDGVFSRRSDFVGDVCTTSITDLTELLVTFDVPLKGSLRPLAFTSNEYYGTGNSIIARCSFSTFDSVKLQFFQNAPTPSTTPMYINDVPDNVHISILLLGQ